MSRTAIELIVVFTKQVTREEAEGILVNTGVPYRKGMDSSRGKLYFYSTGPKFILTFDTVEERSRTITALEALQQLHEVYIPDWTKCKD